MTPLLHDMQGPCMHRDCTQRATCTGNGFTREEDGTITVTWVRNGSSLIPDT